MKKKVVLIVLQMMGGVFIAAGAHSFTGDSTIGFWTGMALFLLSIGAIAVGYNQEKRRACAKVRKEIYDSVVDAGQSIIVNGKAWTKGCRVDPDTSAVIFPS
jgi:hypothetical protein